MKLGGRNHAIAVTALVLFVAALSVAATGAPQADRGTVTLPNGAIYAVEFRGRRRRASAKRHYARGPRHMDDSRE